MRFSAAFIIFREHLENLEIKVREFHPNPLDIPRNTSCSQQLNAALESGQAIDFGNTPGAYDWLAKNAGRFGLKNLPGEPWHYSPNGR